jgi:hypothetical protein
MIEGYILLLVVMPAALFGGGWLISYSNSRTFDFMITKIVGLIILFPLIVIPVFFIIVSENYGQLSHQNREYKNLFS